MTSHDPRHDPLDEHERDLARVVRALPGGEPPAALDVRILKAAQDAVAARRAPARRLAWAGSLWGLGTAAAAVLAVGVSWQLLKQMRPAGQVAPGASSQVVPAAETDRLSVDLIERPKQTYDNSPPPAEQDALRDSDAGTERERQAELGAVGESKAVAEAALPEPFTDEHVDDGPVSANTPMAEASGRDNAFSSALAPAAPPPPPAPAASPPAMDQRAPVVAAQATGTAAGAAAPERRQDLAKESARAEEGAALDRVEVTGSRLKREELAPELYEYVKADQRLAPDAWLRRIRARAEGGDAPAARASLVLFREMHPREPVPENLVQLLRE